MSCSQCWGEVGYRDKYGSHCVECNGAGFFEHWNEGRTREDIERDLSGCKACLEEASRELADPSNAHNGTLWEERVAYWAWYVQHYSLELFNLD